MNKNIPLVIDITQLVHWHGKLTGIPRVMNELTVRYAKKDNVNFVVWDPLIKEYLEVDVNKCITNRAKKIYYKTPLKRVPAVSIFLCRALSKIKRKGIPVPSWIINAFRAYGAKSRVYEFSKDQTLFILWGEQNVPAFSSMVEGLVLEGINVVQIVYDLLPVITPQYSGHSTRGMHAYNKSIVSKSSLVLSISEHTKQDLQYWLKKQNLKVPKIKVFRLGDDFSLSQQVNSKITTVVGLRKNSYILSVGTIEARKNHTLLYYAYRLANSKNIELPKLVIVGRKGWLSDYIYELITKDPLVKDKFVVLESASDEELSWLYKNAKFSIYPSFYEGWGLPIAESIVHGTPVICSETSSMPEVAGDLVEYFNPFSTEDCLNSIQNILDPEVFDGVKKKVSLYKTTSWNQTYEQVDKFIKEVI